MIRETSYRDVFDCEKMMRDFHKESGQRDAEYDPQKVRRYFLQHIDSPKGLALVIEKNGEIVGCFLGNLTRSWFSDAVIAEDSALYVKPEHRGGMNAMRLLKRYQEWAEENGAAESWVFVGAEIDTERTAKLFERCGFAKVGISMRRQHG